MSFKKVLIGTMVASQVVTVQMAQSFTVSIDAGLFGALRGERTEAFVGHEEITRQALVLVSELIELNKDSKNALHPVLEKYGVMKVLKRNRYAEEIVSGAVSENPIIQGNYGTDMPAKSKYPVMNEDLRIDKLPKGVFGSGEHGRKYYEMIRKPFIYTKAGKALALKDLNDQAAFFIRVAFDAVDSQLRAGMLAQVKSLTTDQKAEMLNQYRSELLRQLGDLAVAWGGDWHNNPEGQIVHFLRNYRNRVEADEVAQYGLDSAKNTCLTAREIILQITKNALLKYPEYLAALAAKDPSAEQRLNDVLFLIGHATHMIQDSFSGEHTRRALKGMRGFGDTEPAVLALMDKKSGPQKLIAEANNDIIDICFYGDEQNKGLSGSKSSESTACYHKYLSPSVSTIKTLVNSSMKGDFGDSIWTYGERQETSVLQKIGFGFLSSKNESDKLAKSRKDNVFNRTTNWDGPELVIRRGASDLSEPKGLERWALMNHNARLARTATAKYLYAVMYYISALNSMFERGSKTPRQIADVIKNDNTALRGLMDQYLFEVDFKPVPGVAPSSQIKAATANNPWQQVSLKVPTEVMDSDGREQVRVKVRSLREIMPLGVFRCNQL